MRANSVEITRREDHGEEVPLFRGGTGRMCGWCHFPVTGGSGALDDHVERVCPIAKQARANAEAAR